MIWNCNRKTSHGVRWQASVGSTGRAWRFQHCEGVRAAVGGCLLGDAWADPQRDWRTSVLITYSQKLFMYNFLFNETFKFWHNCRLALFYERIQKEVRCLLSRFPSPSDNILPTYRIKYHSHNIGIDAVKTQHILTTTRSFRLPFYSHTYSFLTSPFPFPW